MSKTVGIVAEYNPFHNGHKKQIDTLRRRGYGGIIVAMSGTAMQRGSLSVFSKFDRAFAAVKCGADAVIEIPYPYSCSGARDYAYAGMFILKNASVDAVSFGSECGDADLLDRISDYLISEEYSNDLEKELTHEDSYAAARERAILSRFDLDADVVRASNDILALEYMCSMKRLGWAPKIELVERNDVRHDSLESAGNISTGSNIRKLISELDFDAALSYVPDEIKDDYRKLLYSGNYFIEDKVFERSLMYSMLDCTEPDLMKSAECTQDLASFIVRQYNFTDDFDSFSLSLSAKTYTRARISRILLSNMIGFPDGSSKEPPYLRILAVNSEKEHLLGMLSENSALPLSHSARRLEEVSDVIKHVVDLESRACDIQSLLSKNEQPRNRNYRSKLIKV